MSCSIFINLIILAYDTVLLSSFLACVCVGIKWLVVSLSLRNTLFSKGRPHTHCGLGNCDVWFHDSKVQKMLVSGPSPVFSSKNKIGECPAWLRGPRLSYKPREIKGKENETVNMRTEKASPTPHPFMSWQWRKPAQEVLW
jgi:hypothetical protein